MSKISSVESKLGVVIFKKIISAGAEVPSGDSLDKALKGTLGKVSDTASSIVPGKPELQSANDASNRALNLKPVIDEDAAAPSSASKQDKFPNFIHQSSPLDSEDAHNFHQPSPLILPVAVAAAVIWIICVMALYFGFFGNISDEGGRLSAAQWISVLMLAFIPAIMIGVIAFALRQLSVMSSVAAQLARAARVLSKPDDAVIGKAKIMSRAVSQELDLVKSRFDATVGDVNALGDVLSSEREKLDSTSTQVKERFDQIGATLKDQHTALEGIASIFDARMASLSDMLGTHRSELQTHTESSEQKLQEARISIEKAISGLDKTTENIRANAVEATDSLKLGHTEVADLGKSLQERSSKLVEDYKTHSAELAAMMTELREEQDNLATSLDERLAKMRDMSLSAKVGSESLQSASEAGRKTVEALASAAELSDTAIKQRFAEMEDMVLYSNTKAENISEAASRRLQDSLSHTRNEISLIEDDMAKLYEKLQNPENLITKAVPDALPPQEDAAQTKARKPITFTPFESETPDAPPSPKLRPAPKAASIFSAKPSAAHDDTAFDLMADTANDAADLAIPDPDISAQSMSDQTVRRAAPRRPLGRAKPERSSRWGWKDVLTSMAPGAVAGSIGAAAAQSSAQAQPAAENMDSQNFQGDIIKNLSVLGLSPSAIVDDGCIIEACNARKASGALSMSQVVARRLGDPVRHLYIKMEENPALKSDARAYTAQYRIGIEAVEDDREAIRMRLESDEGRAFLLCDAALNG